MLASGRDNSEKEEESTAKLESFYTEMELSRIGVVLLGLLIAIFFQCENKQDVLRHRGYQEHMKGRCVQLLETAFRQ